VIFTRPQIDFIQDLINRSRAEARVFTHRLVSQVTDEKHAHSFPVVPVVFLGPYTDEFVTRSMLASPKGYQYSDAALAAAGWLALSASATGSPTYVYAGSVRGPFLPHNSPWTVTIKVTGCGTLYNKAGLKIRQGAFADGWTGNAGIGPSCYNYLWHQTTSLFRLYYGDASANGYTDIAALPSRTTPLYLRIAQTFPGGTRTLTYSWRLGDAGNFTAAKTTTPGANYWTDSLDLGPLAGSTNTVAISVEFDNLTVNYTPDGAPDDYAFIPTSSFDNYTKDHIYVKRTDNTYLRIEPQPWMIVSAYGLLWRYDSGSGWVILEIPHNTLSNILPDDHHAKQHGLSDTANHSGVSGTTDNFLARDVNGLPKDSGYKATDFAPASKGVTNGDSHDHYGGDGAQIDHGTLAGLSDDDHTQYLLKSGGTMTGDIDMDGNKVKGLATPSDDEDASTKEYSDTHVAGLDVDITGLADGNTLVWNETNTKWVPSEGGGGTHALDSGTHTIGGLTTGKLAKIGDSETPLISSTNTDEEISNAVNKTHDQVHDIDGDDHNPLSGNADDLVELDADGKLRSSGVSVEDLEDEIDDAIATHAAMSQDVHGASSDDTLLNTGNSNGARMWFTRMMMEKL